MAKSKNEKKDVVKKEKTSNATKKTTTKAKKSTATKNTPKKVEKKVEVKKETKKEEKKSNVIFFLLKIALLLSACYGLGYLVGKVVGNLFIK